MAGRDLPDQHPISAITGLEDALEGKQPKGNYALRSEIPTVPTKVSAFDNDAGYLTEHQNLSEYARKSDIPDIPTTVSSFENDAGYLTAPATASVGQTVVVKAVDENGKPTEWEAADMVSGVGVSIYGEHVGSFETTLSGAVWTPIETGIAVESDVTYIIAFETNGVDCVIITSEAWTDNTPLDANNTTRYVYFTPSVTATLKMAGGATDVTTNVKIDVYVFNPDGISNEPTVLWSNPNPDEEMPANTSFYAQVYGYRYFRIICKPFVSDNWVIESDYFRVPDLGSGVTECVVQGAYGLPTVSSGTVCINFGSLLFQCISNVGKFTKSDNTVIHKGVHATNIMPSGNSSSTLATNADECMTPIMVIGYK